MGETTKTPEEMQAQATKLAERITVLFDKHEVPVILAATVQALADVCAEIELPLITEFFGDSLVQAEPLFKDLAARQRNMQGLKNAIGDAKH